MSHLYNIFLNMNHEQLLQIQYSSYFQIQYSFPHIFKSSLPGQDLSLTNVLVPSMPS